MRRPSSGDWYPTGPKKPPPDGGIRMKKAGTTWWGQRWIEALERVLRGDSGRLSRGRTYARAGRTHDLVVKDGTLFAKVTGSREKPYQVSIALVQLGEPTWLKAIEGMAKKAQFSAELLASRMPQEIDAVFREAGVSLFPQERADLQTSCSCPDWGDPCKHVAATHYVLGEALDRDPFLLFELRGKTKEQVLAALRVARGEPGQTAAEKPGTMHAGRDSHAHQVPTVKLGSVSEVDYDRPREPLPSLRFQFDEPVSHGALLRQLGVPPGWEGGSSPADALAPLVRAAAESARRIALTEQSEASETDPQTETSAPANEGAKQAHGAVKSTAKRRRSST